MFQLPLEHSPHGLGHLAIQRAADRLDLFQQFRRRQRTEVLVHPVTADHLPGQPGSVVQIPGCPSGQPRFRPVVHLFRRPPPQGRADAGQEFSPGPALPLQLRFVAAHPPAPPGAGHDGHLHRPPAGQPVHQRMPSLVAGGALQKLRRPGPGLTLAGGVDGLDQQVIVHAPILPQRQPRRRLQHPFQIGQRHPHGLLRHQFQHRRGNRMTLGISQSRLQIPPPRRRVRQVHPNRPREAPHQRRVQGASRPLRRVGIVRLNAEIGRRQHEYRPVRRRAGEAVQFGEQGVQGVLLGMGARAAGA